MVIVLSDNSATYSQWLLVLSDNSATYSLWLLVLCDNSATYSQWLLVLSDNSATYSQWLFVLSDQLAAYSTEINLSCIMRKSAFCLCENKGALTVTEQLISAFFHYTDSIIQLISYILTFKPL